MSGRTAQVAIPVVLGAAATAATGGAAAPIVLGALGSAYSGYENTKPQPKPLGGAGAQGGAGFGPQPQPSATSAANSAIPTIMQALGNKLGGQTSPIVPTTQGTPTQNSQLASGVTNQLYPGIPGSPQQPPPNPLLAQLQNPMIGPVGGRQQYSKFGQ